MASLVYIIYIYYKDHHNNHLEYDEINDDSFIQLMYSNLNSIPLFNNNYQYQSKFDENNDRDESL
jgi:hypothetical protein